nr:PilZ domain-containing protein [Desulfobulbaceae bacterium]
MGSVGLEEIENIKNEIDSMVKEKVQLLCARRGLKTECRLSVKTTSKSGATEILIVNHPHEPTCSASKCTFYYHREGQPLRCFECERLKKVKTYIGYKFPTNIVNVHRRCSPRVATPRSSVTFSLQKRQRIFIGKIGDISMEGAKVSGTFNVQISKGDIVMPFTMTLLGKDVTSKETTINVPEATVIWTKQGEESMSVFGVNFDLSQKDSKVLSDYIDMRSIEELS